MPYEAPKTVGLKRFMMSIEEKRKGKGFVLGPTGDGHVLVETLVAADLKGQSSVLQDDRDGILGTGTVR
jgi:hypothetical protein